MDDKKHQILRYNLRTKRIGLIKITTTFVSRNILGTIIFNLLYYFYNCPSSPDTFSLSENVTRQVLMGLKILCMEQEYVDFYEGNQLVELFITEKEDIPLLKEHLTNLPIGIFVKQEETLGGWNVQILINNMTHLYLLGRYIGCDRKRLHDLDF